MAVWTTFSHGVEYNISCNSSCATCGIVKRAIVTCGIITRGIITCGTGHAQHVIALNGTRVGTNMQLAFVIHQQLTYKKMSNSVHNCESCSCMNYQGNGLITHV